MRDNRRAPRPCPFSDASGIMPSVAAANPPAIRETGIMKFSSHLTPPMRVFYAVGSVVLIAIPFMASLDTWLNIALPVLGVMGLAAAGSGL